MLSTFFASVLIPLIVFGLLVFVHEFGHFIVAKWNGVAVVEFAIGFGPALWSRRVGETVYYLRVIPLGGYVRMVGDDPRDLDHPEDLLERFEEEAEEKGEELDEITRSAILNKDRWFLSKGFWGKVSVVLAGPGFNIIFAILLSIFSFWLFGKGEPVDRPEIGRVIPGHPAASAGLLEGDYVRRVNDTEVATWVEFSRLVGASKGQALSLSVERESEDGALEELRLSVTPEIDTSELALLDEEGEERYRIGVLASSEQVPVSLYEATSLGFSSVTGLCVLTVRMIGALVQGAVSTKSLAGPVFIFGEASRSAERGLNDLLGFMIFLSVGLAIFNLLPIPVLDGGHLLFFIIEAVIRRPINLRVREISTQVGMFALLTLMVFVIYNDIVRNIEAPPADPERVTQG